eukprot:scaffold82785_cov30-Tisochrysis_lutea.AAC.6
MPLENQSEVAKGASTFPLQRAERCRWISICGARAKPADWLCSRTVASPEATAAKAALAPPGEPHIDGAAR